MSNNDFGRITDTYLPAIVAEMRAVLGNDPRVVVDDNGELFYGMIHYHMGWTDAEMNPVDLNTGKRIRPILCVMACAAAGGDWEQAVPAAAAIEILHNFSLVHDDIQDASPTRRGRATLWKLWGEAQAINTGDAMFAMAHLALNRLSDRDVPAERVVRAFRRFDETCVQLTQGQYADMSFETRDNVTVDDYMAMITGKTAVLIALSAELGALIAGADDDTIDHYATFGRDLGLAFQIQDDILGIWGNESQTGKSTATDIATRKKTLPVLYALDHSPHLQQLYAGNGSPTFVADVVAELDRSEAEGYAANLAALYSKGAIDHLAAAHPTGVAAEQLELLTDLLLGRTS